jgi:[protein-PII] uridylyltransferase
MSLDPKTLAAPISSAAYLREQRDALGAQVLAGTLDAADFPAALSLAVDGWLEALFARAAEGRTKGYALFAVGGYGRGELAPGSDLDLVLVHRHRRHYKEVAERIWYAVWDTGFRLDHSVRTPSEMLHVARGDLKVALGLLDARCIAGDEQLALPIRDAARDLWRQDAARYLKVLYEQVVERHRSAGELAFLLEPDLKQSGGGLRDLAAVSALAVALPSLEPLARSHAIERARRTIGSARVVLHAKTHSSVDRLALEEQDEIADVLGYRDADALMAALAASGRSISALGDEMWRRAKTVFVDRPQRSVEVALGHGVVLRDGEIALQGDVDPAGDPTVLLRVALAAAEQQALIEQATIERLEETYVPPPAPWDPENREMFIALLGTGDALIPIVDTLDQRHLFERLLPEWSRVRNRPQRNAYHRFTVDRHLLEAVARAAELVGEVARPDLLLLAALLHDIGKGASGDHSEVGTVIAEAVMTRMGYPKEDVETIVDLVAYHLVLPEFATRRDLEDPSTATVVAKLVKDRGRLSLLAALTEADGQATGSAAWGPWKAELVARLVERVESVLDGRPLPETGSPELLPDQEELLAGGALALRGAGRRVTVVAPDQPGLLAAVTGALALNGCNVRRAQASGQANGMAIELFDVEPFFEALPNWEKVERDVAAALDGSLELERRLTELERTYAKGRRVLAAHPAEVTVLIDNVTSATASIVEVRTPDRIGILYSIASTLAGADLDVISALVDTLGHEVIDTFYVRNRTGGKIDGPQRIEEIRTAVEERIRSGG